MGWDSTRNLRFYPKNGDLESIKIEAILERINQTALSLCNEIVYAKNVAGNHYSVKFNSSKLSGDVVFDKETTEVWDLLSYETGATYIGNISDMTDFEIINYETALFTFDQLIIKGNQQLLAPFYREYLPGFNYLDMKNRIIRNEAEATFNLTGFYSANNQHYTGDKKRRSKSNERVSLVAQGEFQAIYPVDCSIFEDLFPKEKNWKKLMEFVKLIEEYPNENAVEGLESMVFLFESRIVKQLDWIESINEHTNHKGTYWQHCSADSWENCINPKWKRFIP